MLVVKGILNPWDLVTYRKGEVALNPATGELMSLEAEMIKIRGRNSRADCMFLEETDNSCRIYKHRPLECSVLKCWNTAEIKRLFLRDMLERSDLIPVGSSLSEIIAGYEKAFPVGMLLEISAATVSDKEDGTLHIDRLEAADRKFRQEAAGLLNLRQDSLDFFFGRPVRVLLSAFMEIGRRAGKKNE